MLLCWQHHRMHWRKWKVEQLATEILDQDIDPLASAHYTDLKPLVNSYIRQLVQTKWDVSMPGKDHWGYPSWSRFFKLLRQAHNPGRKWKHSKGNHNSQEIEPLVRWRMPGSLEEPDQVEKSEEKLYQPSDGHNHRLGDSSIWRNASHGQFMSQSCQLILILSMYGIEWGRYQVKTSALPSNI